MTGRSMMISLRLCHIMGSTLHPDWVIFMSSTIHVINNTFCHSRTITRIKTAIATIIRNFIRINRYTCGSYRIRGNRIAASYLPGP